MTRRDKMRLHEPDLEGVELNTSHARTVLAVLIVAALWSEEFADRWVGMEDVLEYSLHGAKDEDETTRQAFYRARVQLENRMRNLPLAAEHGDRARIQLSGTISASLSEWLISNGAGSIKAHYWHNFVAVRATPPATVDAARIRFQATAARILVTHGRTNEALALLDRALAETPTLHDEMALRLAMVFALGRAGRIRDFLRALKQLAELTSRQAPAGDWTFRMLKARIRVELAYGKYLSKVMGRPSSSSVVDQLAECEALLADARKLQAGLNPADQARLENVNALLLKAHAILADEPIRSTLFASAQSGFLHAFAIAQSVDDAYAMGAALYNVGELTYTKYRLNLMAADVSQAEEALGWFRLSATVSDQLGVTRDLYLDFARIADVLGVLALALHRSGRTNEALPLLEEARRHLTSVLQHGNRLERKLARWIQKRLTSVEGTLASPNE